MDWNCFFFFFFFFVLIIITVGSPDPSSSSVDSGSSAVERGFRGAVERRLLRRGPGLRWVWLRRAAPEPGDVRCRLRRLSPVRQSAASELSFDAPPPSLPYPHPAPPPPPPLPRLTSRRGSVVAWPIEGRYKDSASGFHARFGDERFSLMI